eukprot:CAMPEP_0181069142 /NCGR_PEP_ID=MMETSP1070-20121207/26785_1 /TAXON_ID=265543 /ORGANISM="Minutocellus polymorphus, Strain NH13" /LENGTH=111 /DNA_ID=CAMNT_0023149921 /DNA_START=391 /DNA_END=726 /DNA_ORIENTATION=-
MAKARTICPLVRKINPMKLTGTLLTNGKNPNRIQNSIHDTSARHALIDDKGICGRHSWVVDGRGEELQRVKRSERDNVQYPLIDKLYPFRCQWWVPAVQNADGDPATAMKM